VAALLVTVVLVKATGAWILLAIGIVILFVAIWFRTAFPLLLLMVSMSLYLHLAVTGTFVADQVVSYMSGVFPEERVQSLEFRFNNEELLSDKARERIAFGWGGWGRNRIYNEWGDDISVTDSLWIIAFGNHGAVGVISLTASLLLPAIGFLRRYPASLWLNSKVAPGAALAVIITLYMLDCLLNAMINPIYMLACGGIAGVALKPTRASSVTRIRSSVTQRQLLQQRQRQNN
jgi:O-antigen ligase